MSGRLGADGEMSSLFERLVREFGLRRAVLTCGADGAWFFDQGRLWQQAAVPAEVVDSVGAGDAFAAVLAAAVANDVPLERVAPFAAEVAAYVVSQPGGDAGLAEGTGGAGRARFTRQRLNSLPRLSK